MYTGADYLGLGADYLGLGGDPFGMWADSVLPLDYLKTIVKHILGFKEAQPFKAFEE